MSTANSNNCHVSTTTSKWEDTGGNHPELSDCDAPPILLNTSRDDTNDISLQELIENELALRSSTASANTNNGDFCKINGKLIVADNENDDDDNDDDEETGCCSVASEDLICDTEHDAFVANENRKNLSHNCDNSNASIKSNNICSAAAATVAAADRTVDEVDDFEVLYNEVSSHEGIANGHSMLIDPFESVSETTTLSESSIKNGYERDGGDDAYTELLPREAINMAVLDSLETDTSSKSTDENLIVDDVCGNNDFVPVSEVRVVEGSPPRFVEETVNEQPNTDNATTTTTTTTTTNSCDSFVDEDEWVRVGDAVNGGEEDVTSTIKGENTETVEEIQRPIDSRINVTTTESTEFCNGWSAPRAYEPEVVVLWNEEEEEDYYNTYSNNCEDAEERVNGIENNVIKGGTQRRESEFITEDVTPPSSATLIESIKKSGAKLIEECSYSVTRDSLTNEVVLESNSSAEKKTVKKKKNASEESVTTTKTKKTKKTKKYEEKENISVSVISPTQNGNEDPNFHQIVDDGDELSNVCVRELRSGFGKFDQLTKKSVMQVRSSDPAKAQQHVSQSDGVQDSGSICKTCNKNVFAMEQIKAERQVWHKNCFRCKTCNKQLTVDVYSSHEGELYCKPHFRDLFKPKVVVEEEKPASDKPDLGLEELGSLNVKSRFQVFEKQQIEEQTDKSPICVKRSPSILSKLAKFQAKGMNVGVSSDEFNGIEYEESSSSEEEPAQNDNVTKSSVTKEKPIAFNKMNDVKKNWENGQTARREERLEERRQEKQNIRSRLFMGKQNKMREAYENAVAESERNNVKKDVEVKSEKARSIKEKFEKGEPLQNDDSDEDSDKKINAKNDDLDVFEAGISKKSRSIFQQMDAAIKTQTNNSNNANANSSPQPMQNGHARSRRESESPEKETTKNKEIITRDYQLEDENEVLKKSNTTAKMLSLFRSMEEAQETVPDGPKPMKKFTPPPQSSSSSEGESEEESEEASEASIVHDDVVRASDKTEDDYLKMAQQAAKARSLREKFEKWEPEKQSNNNAINMIDSEQASLDTTKSLRARFESMKATEQSIDKPRPKVNRFV